MYKTVSVLMLILSIAGCYYTFTPNLPPGIKSVAIPIFENDTLHYGLETTLTSQVIDEFIKDGNLAVKGASKADSILHGRIINYVQEAAAYDVSESVSRYRISITVNVSFEDRTSGEILWQEGSLSRSVTYYAIATSAGRGETEAEATERLMEDIAQEIVRRTIEGW